MMILGITGPIGHGKSTFAQALAELEPLTLHLESSTLVAEVANAFQQALTDIPDPYNIEQLNNWLRALPSILEEIVHVHCSFEQLAMDQASIEENPVEYQKLLIHVENLQRNPQLLTENITPKNKENYRPFLQWLGGYLVEKVDSGIWYNEILRRVKQAEAAGTKLCIVGGLRYTNDAAVLRSAGALIAKLMRPGHLQSDMLDPTERDRENIQPDCVILSNGTIADLRLFAQKFYVDLMASKLAKEYYTVNVKDLKS